MMLYERLDQPLLALKLEGTMELDPLRNVGRVSKLGKARKDPPFELPDRNAALLSAAW